VRGRATTQNAIDTTELTGSISHHRKPELFILTAKPDEGDGNANPHGRGTAVCFFRQFRRT
jgi:hypothetical protein